MAIDLLDVVLFNVNPRESHNAEVLANIQALLEGSGAEPFEALIRPVVVTALRVASRSSRGAPAGWPLSFGGSVELGDDCPGEFIGVDRLNADCCGGLGERQFGMAVFGGDWGVEPCGAFRGEAFAFGAGE